MLFPQTMSLSLPTRTASAVLFLSIYLSLSLFSTILEAFNATTLQCIAHRSLYYYVRYPLPTINGE